MLAHGVAAVAAAGLFFGKVPVIGLIAWLGALAAALYYGARVDPRWSMPTGGA